MINEPRLASGWRVIATHSFRLSFLLVILATQASSQTILFTWHREEADACERLGQWSDAIGHLETAQQWSSDASNLFRYRETLARLKRLRAEAEELRERPSAKQPQGDDR